MIPLVLVAGFFGAGKTRFLTTALPELGARGLRAQVLLNDFESAEIDATRLAALNALVTPLSGECVCCSSLEELLTALATMPAVPGSVTLIEANGATETDELLGRLTTDRRLGAYTLPLQVTVVDAKRWRKRWWHGDLEVNQARTATHVHVNWTERVPADRRAAVEEGVRAVNPRATFTTPVAFADDLQRLAAAGEGQRPPMPTPRPLEHEGHAHQGAHPGHGHAHPFASFSVALPDVVARDAFVAFVRGLPRSVVRAKGLVRFADRPGVAFVWNRVDGRKVLTLDPSAALATSRPTALFIGVGMPVDELCAGVAALGAPP